ncbi:MAG: RsmD family RNA methyltransferase [Candidatus Altiarchaeota archaeon]|nr:RsmD family RNA methyltransferase [Candidatus Altiarchaeota archaeon]
MIVFHVSGEHEELPKAEIQGICDSYNSKFKIVAGRGNYLLADVDKDIHALANRLAFTHEVFEAASVTALDELRSVLRGLPHKNASFCIEAHNFENNRAAQIKWGKALADEWGIPVKLDGPELRIHLVGLGPRVVVSTEKLGMDKGGLETRDPSKRPYFHPTALKPKLARLFVNLARVKEGDSILDPFCGSGSILLEAGLMGMRAYGLDMDLEKVWGCKENLRFFGANAEVKEGDATKIEKTFDERFDAIVTDPPYARASKVYGGDLTRLYMDFLSSGKKAVKKGGFIVFAIPADVDIGAEIRKIGFSSMSKYEIYVHRSLSRMLYVLGV